MTPNIENKPVNHCPHSLVLCREVASPLPTQERYILQKETLLYFLSEGFQLRNISSMFSPCS